MELRRKKQKQVSHGDYCSLKQQFIENNLKLTSYGRSRKTNIQLLNSNFFYVSDSIFKGNYVYLIPLDTKHRDSSAVSIFNYLDKKKYFIVHKDNLIYENENKVYVEMRQNLGESTISDLIYLIKNRFLKFRF